MTSRSTDRIAASKAESAVPADDRSTISISRNDILVALALINELLIFSKVHLSDDDQRQVKT